MGVKDTGQHARMVQTGPVAGLCKTRAAFQQVTPHERLLAAVIWQAWKDATAGRGEERSEALAWLHSDGAAAVCDWLGRDVGELRRRLSGIHGKA